MFEREVLGGSFVSFGEVSVQSMPCLNLTHCTMIKKTQCRAQIVMDTKSTEICFVHRFINPCCILTLSLVEMERVFLYIF